MIVNLINNYDKYGFSLKSIKRRFYEEWREPYIEIRYITNNKAKNIYSSGYPFKDFTYSIKTKNDKEIIKGIYNDIKNMDIVEATKYLLTKFPENANNIIQYIPSYILAKSGFYSYLINYVNDLPNADQESIYYTLDRRFQGIDYFYKSLELDGKQML